MSINDLLDKIQLIFNRKENIGKIISEPKPRLILRVLYDGDPCDPTDDKCSKSQGLECVKEPNKAEYKCVSNLDPRHSEYDDPDDDD